MLVLDILRLFVLIGPVFVDPILVDPPGSGPAEFAPTGVPVQTIRLTPLDQTVDDRGALDLSLRRIDPGLDLPTGYRSVYARPGGGLMRANGGLAAVFPRSIYVRTQEGVVPDVPAGTRFVIGGLPMGEERGHGRLLAVDPMRPDAVPAVVDDSSPGRTTSGLGFGPGYRVVRSVEPSYDDGLARFQADSSYRRVRLRRLVSKASVREGTRSDRPVEDGQGEG